MWQRQHFLLRSTIAFLLVASSLCQQIGFTVYPQQVLTGLTYQVAWLSNGQPATLQLVKNGIVEATLFTAADAAVNSFQWPVEDDADGGIDYTLNLVVNGQTIAAPIMVIEDEDGLVVSGTTITAPSATAAITSIPTTLSFPPETSATATGTAPTSPTPTTNAATTNASEGLSGGSIAGIVVGIVAGIIFVVLGIWLYRRSKRSTSVDREDGMQSFLALRGGGSGHEVAHGTSPEFKEAPGDENFGVGGGAALGEKSTAAGKVRNSTMSSISEIDGKAHMPWNELDSGPHSSGVTSTFEADGRVVNPVFHELPAEDVTRR